jgi:hypothetical protein
MAKPKAAPSGRCQGTLSVRIERFLSASASIKGAAWKFAINYHALSALAKPRFGRVQLQSE